MHHFGGLCSKLAIFHCVRSHVSCHSTCHHGDELSFSVSRAVVHTLQHAAAAEVKQARLTLSHHKHVFKTSTCAKEQQNPWMHRSYLRAINVLYFKAVWCREVVKWMHLKVSIILLRQNMRGVNTEKKLEAARKGQLPLQISVLSGEWMGSHHRYTCGVHRKQRVNTNTIYMLTVEIWYMFETRIIFPQRYKSASDDGLSWKLKEKQVTFNQFGLSLIVFDKLFRHVGEV